MVRIMASSSLYYEMVLPHGEMQCKSVMFTGNILYSAIRVMFFVPQRREEFGLDHGCTKGRTLTPQTGFHSLSRELGWFRPLIQIGYEKIIYCP